MESRRHIWPPGPGNTLQVLLDMVCCQSKLPREMPFEGLSLPTCTGRLQCKQTGLTGGTQPWKGSWPTRSLFHHGPDTLLFHPEQRDEVSGMWRYIDREIQPQMETWPGNISLLNLENLFPPRDTQWPHLSKPLWFLLRQHLQEIVRASGASDQNNKKTKVTLYRLWKLNYSGNPAHKVVRTSVLQLNKVTAAPMKDLNNIHSLLTQ